MAADVSGFTAAPRVLVLLNGAAGSADCAEAERHLAAAARSAGVDATIAVVAGSELTRRAEAAIGVLPPFDAIVAAGGDGTISAVASALAGSGRRFGVVPMGTLNHFARDVGLPADPEHAFRILAAGRERAIDVGEVNGRIFVNNAVIGLYPEIVRDRDRQRHVQGRSKWLAHALSTLRWLVRFPMLRLRLRHPEGKAEPAEQRTPLVFIGNNRYAMTLLSLGRRARLDEGILSAYVVRRRSRLGALGLGLAILAGRLDQARDFDTFDTSALTVGSRRRRLRVALDGEVHLFRPPLAFRSRPGALRVIVPADSDA